MSRKRKLTEPDMSTGVKIKKDEVPKKKEDKTLAKIIEITNRREFCKQFEKGAVMFKCKLDLDIDKLIKDAGIEIYHPKNPKHFWMGVSCRDAHITVHHGFELKPYEDIAKKSGEDGYKLFKYDVDEILDALDEDSKQNNPDEPKKFLDRIENTKIKGEAHFFPANPMTKANGEDDYFTVILRGPATEELKEFRQALFKVLPHTQSFPDPPEGYSVHLSIATVPDEKNRDLLIEKLKGATFSLGDLMIGYNINKNKK
jgi:hypothetical protein